MPLVNILGLLEAIGLMDTQSYKVYGMMYKQFHTPKKSTHNSVFLTTVAAIGGVAPDTMMKTKKFYTM